MVLLNVVNNSRLLLQKLGNIGLCIGDGTKNELKEVGIINFTSFNKIIKTRVKSVKKV